MASNPEFKLPGASGKTEITWRSSRLSASACHSVEIARGGGGKAAVTFVRDRGGGTPLCVKTDVFDLFLRNAKDGLFNPPPIARTPVLAKG